ncbi:MAG TPA: XRE family transcriptional regulator [Opitutae bacterium]|nr:XRE family transcriptional regulator [Opitutae bacterium]
MEKENQPSMEEAFGDVLRTYRKSYGLTQSNLAKASGLSKNFISFCERGQQLPNVNSLFLISYALRISPAQFIEEVHKKAPRPNR